MRYIYRITNLVNGKTYVGQHKVREGRTITSDTYWGSGKIITESIKKYGKENFKKEILVSGDFTKEEINRFEICAIFFERLNHHSEYNISDGGESPFSNSEFAKLCGSKGGESSKNSEKWKAICCRSKTELEKEKISEGLRNAYKNGFSQKGEKNGNYGHKGYKLPNGCHNGSKNSQFGTHWYTNGEVNIKVKECPEGFKPGRV